MLTTNHSFVHISGKTKDDVMKKMKVNMLKCQCVFQYTPPVLEGKNYVSWYWIHDDNFKMRII